MYQYVNISSWKYTIFSRQRAQVKYLKVLLRGLACLYSYTTAWGNKRIISWQVWAQPKSFMSLKYGLTTRNILLFRSLPVHIKLYFLPQRTSPGSAYNVAAQTATMLFMKLSDNWYFRFYYVIICPRGRLSMSTGRESVTKTGQMCIHQGNVKLRLRDAQLVNDYIQKQQSALGDECKPSVEDGFDHAVRGACS